MMNPNTLMDLARERRRDLLDDAARRRLPRGDDVDLIASDYVPRSGRAALLIDARVRAQARLRVPSAVPDLT